MTIVFVTGIFDLLHVEHVRFLKAAKALGHRLVAGVESDFRVKKLKGKFKPIINQFDRKEMLEALSVVDEVIILPPEFDTAKQYEKILRDVRADIYAVSENSPFLENKKRICQKAGVKLVVARRYNPKYSTTKLIAKLLQ